MQHERIDIATSQAASTNSASVTVLGGAYVVFVEGTLGSATYLQQQHPSGNWANIGTALSADTVKTLPPGAIRLATGSGASGVYCVLIRVSQNAASGGAGGDIVGLANPTAMVGLSAVNGSGFTAMRSDAAPALDQSISPTWNGNHTFSAAAKFADGSTSAPGVYWGTNTGFSHTTGNLALSISGVNYDNWNLSAYTRTTTGGGTSEISAFSEGIAVVKVRRCSDNAQAPALQVQKARGTLASPAAVQQNDIIYQMQGFPYHGSAFLVSSIIQSIVIEPTPSSTALGTQFRFQITPVGSVTTTEIARWDHTGGLQMFGANTVVGPNRGLYLRAFTVATLPAAGTAGRTFLVTDALAPAYNAAVVGGGTVKIPVFDTGAAWNCG